jgi:hypothetical protein
VAGQELDQGHHDSALDQQHPDHPFEDVGLRLGDLGTQSRNFAMYPGNLRT